MSSLAGNISQKVEMEFPAKLDALEEMMKYLRSCALENHLDEKMIRKAELASEEAIVNIILYAYPDKPGTLFIECTRNGNRFTVILKDKGLEFNPIDIDVNPQVGLPVDERKIGGLGIFLLRKVIDEATYRREEDYNVLRLSFNLKS